MNSSPSRDKSLNRDLILNIMSRLSGSTIAAAASTCRDLRDAAEDDRLWQIMCHKTWPSTSMITRVAISKTSFKRLYAEAFPLILYETSEHVPKKMPTCITPDTSLSPSDFTSLVDIYYEGRSIFSRVKDGIAELTHATSGESSIEFMCYPFKLELSGVGVPERATNLPSHAFTNYCDGREEYICNKIVKNIRLSWILFHKRKGKAVNISSWKPRWIQRDHPSNEDFTLCFECVVPIEDGEKNHKLVVCSILVKCRLTIKERGVRWKEIALVIKDIDGSHLNGEQSMRVMNKALTCARSMNHSKVEMGYQLFRKKKRVMRSRKDREEPLADLLCASAAIAALVGICYACSTLMSS